MVTFGSYLLDVAAQVVLILAIQNDLISYHFKATTCLSKNACSMTTIVDKFVCTHS